MRIAIAGGAGFLGGHLTTQLRAMGHDVTVLARTAPQGETLFIPFCLETGLSPSALKGFDVLIHAAYDFAATDGRNVDGSVQLFDAATQAGVQRLVFISSLSAFEGCRSQYGAMKLAVEKHVTALGGCNIRLGFLCDNSNHGLSGNLKKLAKLPVIPLPGGGRQNLFTIRAEDLGPAFLKLLEQFPVETVNLAHSEPVSLASLMRIFAREQGTSAIFVPFPWRLLWAPLRLLEAAGIRTGFRSDSLVSLMNQNPDPGFAKLKELGINLRKV